MSKKPTSKNIFRRSILEEFYRNAFHLIISIVQHSVYLGLSLTVYSAHRARNCILLVLFTKQLVLNSSLLSFLGSLSFFSSTRYIEFRRRSFLDEDTRQLKRFGCEIIRSAIRIPIVHRRYEKSFGYGSLLSISRITFPTLVNFSRPMALADGSVSI